MEAKSPNHDTGEMRQRKEDISKKSRHMKKGYEKLGRDGTSILGKVLRRRRSRRKRQVTRTNMKKE
eukprot:864334-Prorocentrum_lima.AAC.1